MDLKLYISPTIAKKLKDKHGVETTEVQEAWDAYDGTTLEDTREQHRTNPATMWFLSKTKAGRILKVVYVPEDGIGYLRTSYDANATEIWLFKLKGGVL
jgi:hypothetical protein